MKRILIYLPNSITFVRIFLTIPFIFLLINYFHHKTILILAMLYIIYIFIVLSDFLDGRLARLLKLESIFGAVLDIVADSIFVITTFIILNFLKILPSWYTIIIYINLIVFILTSIFLHNRKLNKFIFFNLSGKLSAIMFYIIPILVCTVNIESNRYAIYIQNLFIFLTLLLAIISIAERLIYCLKPKNIIIN